ncbi:MAG: hypothetical protein L0332_16060 [Chloroflexi bacterium]|nr:hypothetical protein [Chloroflexota bacterium]MCI0580591.1 hypothetical protein [Chloroflexota bacterium]MCI0648887.1 hypothetical protein [Chloroflexota bacterium]MCI0728217.1 hypothetical protein [Chloroflexota bacterium]
MRRLLFLSLLLVLAACNPEETGTPTAELAATLTLGPSVTPPPTETASPTPATAVATTPAASPAPPTHTPAGQLTPVAPTTVTPAATITTPPNIPFQLAEDFPAGVIRQLWVAPDGALWVLTDEALYARGVDGWETLSLATPTLILDADRELRVWALFDEGRTVAYLPSGGDWFSYGPLQGWTSQEPDYARMAYADEVTVDRLGQVWLADGRNGLHRLDPTSGAWTTLEAAALGFPPPPAAGGALDYDERLFFTDVAVDDLGQVWASACAVRLDEEGPIPVQVWGGEGVRWFDGATWQAPAEVADTCIYDIEVDANGLVWLGGRPADPFSGNYNLYRHNPAAGDWLALPIPESPAYAGQSNPRYINDIHLDGAGRPWILVEQGGGAGHLPGALYYLEGEEWITALETLPEFSQVVLGPAGEAAIYLFEPVPYQDTLLDGLVYYRNGELTAIGPLPGISVTSLAIDGAGRTWLVGTPFDRPEMTTLWYHDPAN